MNLDDLRDDINQSAEEATIAKPHLISRGRDLVQTIRSTMRIEIIAQLFFLIVFFAMPAIVPFAELPQAVYLIFTFIIGLMTVSYIFILGRFLWQTSNMTTNTRNVLMQFVYDAKLSVSGYVAFVIAGCAMLPIIVFAMFTGTPIINSGSTETFEKWFLLRLNAWEFARLISGFLGLFLGSCLVTKYWAKFCYGRHIRKLELLIEELDAE